MKKLVVLVGSSIESKDILKRLGDLEDTKIIFLDSTPDLTSEMTIYPTESPCVFADPVELSQNNVPFYAPFSKRSKRDIYRRKK